MKYINLRAAFIWIYREKKGILNLQKIEKKLKYKPIEAVMYHLDDMVDLLNMKFKQRFVNNLDVVENMVKICQKLEEKGAPLTSRLLYTTERTEDAPGRVFKPAVKYVPKKAGDNDVGKDFEVV